MADAAGRRASTSSSRSCGRCGRPDGCPWDREQTLQSLRPFVLEETYELLDAIDRGDLDGLREELGDFLFEVVFLAQIAEEAGHFSIADAVDGDRRQADAAPSPRVHARRPAAGRGAATSRPARCRRRWEDLKAESGRRRARPRSRRSTACRARCRRCCARTSSAAAPPRRLRLARGRPTSLDKIDEEVREVREAVAARRRRAPSKRKSATCSSPWPTTPASWASNPRPRCAGERQVPAALHAHGGDWRGPTGRGLASLSLEAQNALWERVKAEQLAPACAATAPAR